MKRTIAYRLCIVIIISMVIMAFVSYYFQVRLAKENTTVNSTIRINQVEQILKDNDIEINKLKENLKEDYLVRAKAAAYMIKNHPEVEIDLPELKKIASLLQIDEIHLFDREGTLYGGTEPKYYNYTFHSGEQMSFFLPMLEDESLELCQDMLPNTAENKMIQYTAVWREDKKGIVQIGMEPIRLIEALEKNELSHIFSIVTVENGSTLFAADSVTGVILGSTKATMTGRYLKDYGIQMEAVSDDAIVTKNTIKSNGLKRYCVMKKSGDVIIGMSVPYVNMYQNIPDDMRMIVFSLLILSVAIVLLILKMLDYYIINGMHKINYDMEKIAAGDLDYRIQVTKLPEFIDMSNNINHMVSSLLKNTGKLSLIFQNVNIPIAVYEYNLDMKRVLATSKISEILAIPEEDMNLILGEQSRFVDKMKQVFSNPCQQEEDVYLIHDKGAGLPVHLAGEGEKRYVKIKTYQEQGNTLGIIVDVTEEILEKMQIKYERDVDLLTGLNSRRAFFSEMDRLFTDKEALKLTALLMMDTDNLKFVNDRWGHEYGDAFLKKAAELLKGCGAQHKITARLSGDEFVMFLYGMETEEEIEGYINQLYDDMKLTVLNISEEEKQPVCFSCGYVIFRPVSSNYQDILKMADKTMYQAKRERKGQYVKCKVEKEL